MEPLTKLRNPEHARNDGPTAVHLERCREYLIHPPSEEWDGVHQLATK